MKIIFTIIFCFLTGIALCQSPAFAWSARIGADSTDAPNDIKTDAAGNVYTTGFCEGIIDFDPGPGTYTLAPAGGTINPWATNIYITKMDASGNLLWAKRMGDTVSFFYANSGVSISVDALGSVYVMGYFIGTVDFDPGPGIYNLSNANINQLAGIFILKLDASGNFIWADQLSGGYDNGYGTGMVLDANNNLYLSGWFRGTIDMDPGPAVLTFTSPPFFPQFDAFILKLDGGGNFIFAKQLHSVGTYTNVVGTMAHGLSIDVSGNIYATGDFDGAVDFDPGSGTYNLTSTAVSHFILKLDANGNFVWAEKIATGGIWANTGIVAGGNCLLISGTFYGSPDFDPGPGSYSLTATGTLPNQLSHNQFILKLDLAGNFIWAKSLASTIDSYGCSIALDAASSVYALGSFDGSADFDPGPGTFNITSNGGSDGFIMKLDASGNFVWAETVGGVSDDWLGAVSIGVNGDIYLTGTFQATVDFDPGTSIANLTSAGHEDIFIAKWSQCSAAAPPSDLTPMQNKIICENTSASLFAYGVNPVGWYASLTSTLSLGTGTNYISVPLTVGNYTYYAADPVCNGVSRTAVTLTVDACTAIRSIIGNENNFLNAYPVPSGDGLISLSIGTVANDMNFEVYNTSGELIVRQKAMSEISSLDLSDRPPGFYIIKLLSNNKQVAIQKIVRQ